LKYCKNRNEQFENIARLKQKYEPSDNPIISIDTKKKEYIGNFYRDGKLYAKDTISTWDHDFNTFAEGIIIPHSIYDLKENEGYVNIGTSHDTAQFACDSIKHWWNCDGKKRYPNATSILMLCDGGGSNSSKHYVFKEELQKMVDDIGIEIRVAHYPAYASKYNPIEHKMFPHITRACQGVVFKNIEIVKNLISSTKTEKGLRVKANIIDKLYETGKCATKGFKDNMRIVFDNFLPAWNYTVVPG